MGRSGAAAKDTVICFFSRLHFPFFLYSFATCGPAACSLFFSPSRIREAAGHIISFYRHILLLLLLKNDRSVSATCATSRSGGGATAAQIALVLSLFQCDKRFSPTQHLLKRAPSSAPHWDDSIRGLRELSGNRTRRRDICPPALAASRSGGPGAGGY
jgi:hypothetical protein